MSNPNTSDSSTQLNETTKKTKSSSLPGKPRGATYDGNLCMICNDRASGFHYGVLACEGCKGFFKRVCKEKLKSLDDNNNALNKRHCVFGGNCEINVRTRNRCQYCRIQKCIDLGMSKDGIKLGRRSKKFKQNLTQVVNKKIEKPENETNSELYKQQIIAILQDNKLVIKAIDLLSAAAASVNNSPDSNNNVFMLSPGTSSQVSPVLVLNNVNQSVKILDNSQIETVIENILQAFKDTKSVFSNTENINFQDNNFIDLSENLKNLFSETLVNILNRTKFLDHINLLIENTVLFAKNVPFFMNINESDRITLLKSAVFEIICLRHSIFYKYSTNGISSLATLADCALVYNNIGNDTNLVESKFYMPFLNFWLTRDWISERIPDIKKFVHLLFEFYFYFNSICLNESEFSVFCSYLLFCSDDSSLTDVEKINKNRNFYKEILLNQLENKQGEQNKMLTKEFLNTWLSNCCKKLKDLNAEHSNILDKLKKFVQFPDLYAELYNL